MLVIDAERLSTFVADERKKRGLTQNQVAQLVGLTQKTISAFENNSGPARIETLFKILAAIGLSIDITDKKETEQKLAKEWDKPW